MGTSPAAQKTPSSEASPASPNAFGLPKEVQGLRGFGFMAFVGVPKTLGLEKNSFNS